MKLTKSTLKQIIQEELRSDDKISADWKAVHQLGAKIEDSGEGPWDDAMDNEAKKLGYTGWEELNTLYSDKIAALDAAGLTAKSQGLRRGFPAATAQGFPHDDDMRGIDENKLTKSKLEQIVQEELENILKEGRPTVAYQKFGGLGDGLPGVARRARALPPIGSSDMPAHSPVSTDSPSFVLHYNTGEERKIQLDDEQWHQFHDMDPDLQDVEKLRSILSPEDTRGLEDTEPVMESLTKSKLMKIVQEETYKLIKEYGYGMPSLPSGRRQYDYYEVGNPGDIGHNPSVEDYNTARAEADRYGLRLFGWDGRYKEGPLEEVENSETDPGLEASRKQATHTDHEGSTSFLPRKEPKQSSRWNRRNK